MNICLHLFYYILKKEVCTGCFLINVFSESLYLSLFLTRPVLKPASSYKDGCDAGEASPFGLSTHTIWLIFFTVFPIYVETFARSVYN